MRSRTGLTLLDQNEAREAGIRFALRSGISDVMQLDDTALPESVHWSFIPFREDSWMCEPASAPIVWCSQSSHCHTVNWTTAVPIPVRSQLNAL